MKRIIKSFILMLIGGSIYYSLEVLFRGHSHWTMALLGGLCFICIGAINIFFSWDMPLWKQVLIGAVIITVIEFIAGLILNIWLKLNIWDYSNMPLNVMGQICLPFMALWFFLSIVAVILDDYLRYWLFGEEKPRYRIL